MTTTNDLIANVKSRALIPVSQMTISDAVILSYINEEIQNSMMAKIVAIHEEYQVTEETFDLANADRMLIPTRAYGGKLRNVSVLVNGVESKLNRLMPEDRQNHNQVTLQTLPWFYIQGNYIRFTIPWTGTVILSYFRKPSKMVLQSDARTILAIDLPTNTVTVNNVASWMTLNNKIDVINADYPSILNAVSSPVLDVNAPFKKIILPDVSNLSVGDLILQAGQTSVVQIPEELVPQLAERVAMRIFKSIGDQQGVTNCQQSLLEMEANLALILEDRVVSDPIILMNEGGYLRNRY